MEKYKFEIVLQEARDVDPRWDARMSVTGMRRIITTKGYDAEDVAEQMAKELVIIVKSSRVLQEKKHGKI